MLLLGKWIDYCAMAFEIMGLAPFKEEQGWEGFFPSRSPPHAVWEGEVP